MALTDQPYLPLYVDDWMNNNKLKMCSPAVHGVMISLMCIMHKEENYGKILLKQKFKQTDNQIKNFAIQLAKLSAFDLFEIEEPLNELIESEIIEMSGDLLICKRMVKDAELSAKRAKSGRSGGSKTQSKKETIKPLKNEKVALANNEANTVNVNESVNENEIDYQKIIDSYHKFCPQLPNVQVLSPKRKTSIKARIKQHGFDKVSEVLEIAGNTDFLNGENKENWRANFDWLLNTENFVKVLEGNYKTQKSNNESQTFSRNR